MTDKFAPKPPKVGASKAEHKKFAKEVENYEPYGREPKGGMKPHDSVPDKEGPRTEEE